MVTVVCEKEVTVIECAIGGLQKCAKFIRIGNTKMRALKFVSISYLGHWNLFRQGCYSTLYYSNHSHTHNSNHLEPLV